MNKPTTQSGAKWASINQPSTSIQAPFSLRQLVQSEQYVGELINMSFEEARVQVHDHFRQRVGGIGASSFLIATRINADGGDELSVDDEDFSTILLRVLDSTPLPGDQEKERIRSETAERASGGAGHWDQAAHMDAHTYNLLAFGGIRCRVVGTFFEKEGKLEFGSDLANYYPNRGLKVYKPVGKSLARIVNFGLEEGSARVPIGTVRYSSTNRKNNGVADVRVFMTPKDLDAQKTALFGMTRTGKSNTVKILVQSVYALRAMTSEPQKIGQLIFDPNGEYANDNMQDSNNGVAASIKSMPQNISNGRADDIQTYGVFEHVGDPGRHLMKINFFSDDDAHLGKELINLMLREENKGQSIYMDNFIQLTMFKPDTVEQNNINRWRRHMIAYMALLARAGFDPGKKTPHLTGVFSQDMRDALKKGLRKPDDANDNDKRLSALRNFERAASILSKPAPNWSEVEEAMPLLGEWLDDPSSSYHDFNEDYRNNSSTGESWADEDLKKILTMFKYPNGARMIGKARIFHSGKAISDYAEKIYQDLKNGKCVIIDQSVGDERVHKIAAERIMWRIFLGNSEIFRHAEEPPKILTYIEEAHNLLPKGSEEDTSNVWARVAKEGAKLKIGMIYSTQEVSSIQRNILKNTTNWFISHLNNKEEIRELESYYDFEDFSSSILKAQDKGFIRLKTRSNPFVVPVQVDRFTVDTTIDRG